MAGLGVSADKQKIRFQKFQMPAEKPAVKLIDGSPEQQVQQLVGLLRNEAKVL